MAISIGDWLASARSRLVIFSETPALDSQSLLAAVLNTSRSWVLSHPEIVLDANEVQRLDTLLTDLANGTPLAYLTGFSHFYGMHFRVSPQVLIPRPETELLVEKALSILSNSSLELPVLDVGTGSGCIAISLACNGYKGSICAVDISMDALQIARQNSIDHQVTRSISLLQSDLASAVSGYFQLICANLPYIPTSTLAHLKVAETEPTLALDGGPDGLRYIDRLLADCRRITVRNSWMLFEIESGQGNTARNLAGKHFPDGKIYIENDLQSHNRLLMVQV